MSIADTIRSLAALPKESEWVEFKVNNSKPETIGKNISALSNSACLKRVPKGYIVWGIENETHNIVGTDFDPSKKKCGNEELESWIATRLSPRIDFVVQTTRIDTKEIVVFIVDAAFDQPVRFSGEAYIRIGSSTRKLKDYPDKERKIWERTEDLAFEQRLAMTDVSGIDVLQLLDYNSYFSLTKRNTPHENSSILEMLSREGILEKKDTDYCITFLGAILFAKNLDNFDIARGKAIRVISYKGQDRLHSTGDQLGSLGYAIAFEKLITFICAQVPTKEVFSGGLRTSEMWFPEIAIRELVANALIHQDMSIGGAAPKIEIFSDRIEITNPGKPLIDTQRFIDHPPITRNARIVSIMYRIGICEQRGSGIDRVIKAVEEHQLPAPSFIAGDQYLKAILYGPRIFSKMARMDKVRACYQHCVLRFESNEAMTNSSLRERFGIVQKNQAVVSRIIRDTMDETLIKEKDPSSNSRKMASYIPWWA